MPRVVVTGAGGYIGIPLAQRLLSDGNAVVGLDRYFFGLDKLASIARHPQWTTVVDDIRTVKLELLENVDAVIDLAGLSNDATSEIDPKLTEDINLRGALRIAKAAKERGVRRYVYSSSASVYGAGSHEGLNETSAVAPQTQYAKSKVAVERELLRLCDDKFTVVILRNATVYGIAPRMRFDLVVNVMTMRAWKERVIYIMGGGKQWRPLVHVKDVVQALMLALAAPHDGVNGEIFNVGSNEQNYTVEQLAKFVMDVVPNVTVHKIPDDPDRRSYHLAFDKIKSVLGFQHTVQVHEGIVEVKQALESGGVQPDDPTCFTLQWYKSIMEWERRIQELSIGGRVLGIGG
jgi:nucleoside-diphosphate-sugar epimerase